jgi:tetratricopeptide (TPR) repeat protein
MRALVLAASAWTLNAYAAVELNALWDFSDPALSEQRFRAALATASGDDALILTTQLARSRGLQRDLEGARELLQAMEPKLAGTGHEARARHALEWGRAHISAITRPDERTPKMLATARAANERALAAARAGGLDGLAVDAVHMMAFVDDTPADQLKWGRQALAIIEASSQPAAKAWEASIRNNIGFALHQLGRHDEALPQFEAALALREKAGNARSIHIARWMVARTLRLLGRIDEALALQLRLEREAAAAGKPDAYVFEELELLYRAKGDAARATAYAEQLATLRRRGGAP